MKTMLGLFAVLMLAAVAVNAQQCTPCDLNGDGGWTTVADYAVILGGFGKHEGQAGYDRDADVDGSGSVTSRDWAMFLEDCPIRDGGK